MEDEEGGRESTLPAAEEGEGGGGGEGGVAGSSPEHREIVQSLVVEEVATKVEVDITYAAPPQVFGWSGEGGEGEVASCVGSLSLSCVYLSLSLSHTDIHTHARTHPKHE